MPGSAESKKKGSTPLNFYPNTRSFAATSEVTDTVPTEDEPNHIGLISNSSHDSDEPNLINLDTPDHIDVIVHVQQAENLNNQPLETINEIIEPENLINNIETNTELDIMASAGIALPKFYDEFNNIPVEWWYLFESFKIFHNLQDDRALASLAFSFDGQAKIWLQSLAPEVRDDMAALKAAFMLRFSNNKSNKLIYKLQQLPGENGNDYLTRVQRLAMNTELGESTIVELALNGLLPHLKASVTQSDPKTYNELRQAIDIAINVTECHNHSVPSTKVNNVPQVPATTENPATASGTTDINSLLSSFIDSMKTVVRQEVMALTPNRDNREERQFSQVPCRGCGKDKLQNSNLKDAMGVGGNVLPILGVISLPLVIGNNSYWNDFYVFENVQQSILLGNDFLLPNKVDILNSVGSVFFPDKENNTINTLELNSGLARTVSGTTIPPFHQADIPVTISNVRNQVALLEPLPSLPEKSLAGAKCCVSLYETNKSILRVMNPTKDAIYLPANYVVASVSALHPEMVLPMSTSCHQSPPKIPTQNEKCEEEYLDFDLNNADLSSEQKQLLKCFLNRNRQVFAKDLSELGHTHLYNHVIDTGNALPIKKRFYRQSPQVLADMNRQIDQMLEYDIIEESDSEWQSPVVMCKKKSGELRFCVDYRAVNKISRPKLISAGLTLKPSKCLFARPEVIYLGHKISKKGVQADISKVEAVESFPVPKTEKNVRSFLGLTNYYRKFIKGYSHLVTPLNRLLRKDVPFEWTEKCQKAFDQLKQSLCSSPILAYPNMSRPFILTTDASGSAIAYILGQLDSEGQERVIAYGGRSLSEGEKAWPISELECLAVLEGIKTYHVYLANSHFKVYTDHHSLKWLSSIKQSTGRLARWSVLLQGL
ncbi:Hypothetical predicted protein [Mytilus galloprovincialis]|uniref:RNA-directed DNA polymerase n=1 Tax=Mytilus galloprovincialis TaxID=29158 RepID=A0A8B6CLD6_MYTGA|nr:Hypothetical predicted protein [Mytilus galloprovincialis]